ncbi:hypothetical protein BZA77DRAFT_318497 [Pyronema omphalodes]|nr:hypothetical protein BZA77DRAFT_318497 [Pyronema omphalodes]
MSHAVVQSNLHRVVPYVAAFTFTLACLMVSDGVSREGWPYGATFIPFAMWIIIRFYIICKELQINPKQVTEFLIRNIAFGFLVLIIVLIILRAFKHNFDRWLLLFDIDVSTGITIVFGWKFDNDVSRTSDTDLPLHNSALIMPSSVSTENYGAN